MKKTTLVSFSLAFILTACSAHPAAEPILNSKTPTPTMKVEQNTIAPSATPVSMKPSSTSSSNPEVKNIYYNKKYNFNLTLPDGWLGKYEVLETVDGNNIGSVDFISIKNKSAGGSVFAIGIWPKAMWDSQGEDVVRNTHTTKIGEKGENVFTIGTPTDVEYDLKNENAKSEYNSMYDDVKSIQSTFILK